jgi:CheY-like chemotaxis protein
MPHKLLLADDSVTIQRVIELTFADEDIQVIAVGDGKQAIERIQAERPDIVLADIGMPEHDGYEVAAFVKGHADLAHVPVVLLTGAFEPIDEGRARGVGCDGVLVKPFEPQMVINRVKDLLAGRHPAGLWAAATLAQQAPRGKPAPPADFDLRTAAQSPAPAKPDSASLEDYFDRLDAAIADMDSSGSAPPGQAAPSAGRAPLETRATDSADALAGWDPDLTGDPARPSPPPPREPPLDAGPVAAPAPRTAAQPPAPPMPAPAASAQPTAAPQAEPLAPAAAADPEPGPALPTGASLAEAFAALLSAEQGQPIALPSVRPEDIPDDTIEQIVRRVIERMGTSAVQQTVLDVAERLVREEIARIKRGT